MTPREEEPHGTLRKYRYGCRCDECLAVNRAYHQEYRRRMKTRVPRKRKTGGMVGERSVIRPDDGDPRHGSYNGYHNLGCRCVLCSKAGQENRMARRAKVALDPDSPLHGTLSGYNAHYCRCDRCKAVATAYRRRLYAQAKKGEI